jgi:hypothetical protein
MERTKSAANGCRMRSRKSWNVSGAVAALNMSTLSMSCSPRCYGEPLYFYVSASSKRFAHRVICSIRTPNRNTTKCKTQQQKTRICSQLCTNPMSTPQPTKTKIESNREKKKKRSLKLRNWSDPIRTHNLKHEDWIYENKRLTSCDFSSRIDPIRSDPILTKTHEDEDWRL